MGTHMKIVISPFSLGTFFSRIGVVPARQKPPPRAHVARGGNDNHVVAGGWSDVSQSCCHTKVAHTALFHEQRHCETKISRSRPDSHPDSNIKLNLRKMPKPNGR